VFLKRRANIFRGRKMLYLDATELAALVRSKQISLVEVVRAHLDRIEEVNPKLNAIVTLVAEQAIEAARGAEAAVMAGRELGLLHGVPFTAKDSLDTAGVLTQRDRSFSRAMCPRRMRPLCPG
jgi:aspartyl-tRNA(Asn)/glutamyl-tRNA(Gln) amidotransferase subunit A